MENICIGSVKKASKGVLIYLGGLLFLLMLSIYPIPFFIGLYFWILLIINYNFSTAEFFTDFVIIKKTSFLPFILDYKIPIDKIVQIKLYFNARSNYGTLNIKSENGFADITMSFVDFESTKPIIDKIYSIRPALNPDMPVNNLSKTATDNNQTFIKKSYIEKITLAFYIGLAAIAIYYSFLSEQHMEYFPIEKIAVYSIIPILVLTIFISTVFKKLITKDKIEIISEKNRKLRIIFSDFKTNFIILLVTISLGIIPLINNFELKNKPAEILKGKIIRVGNSRHTKVIYIQLNNKVNSGISVKRDSPVAIGDDISLKTKVGNLNILYDIEAVYLDKKTN